MMIVLEGGRRSVEALDTSDVIPPWHLGYDLHHQPPFNLAPPYTLLVAEALESENER